MNKLNQKLLAAACAALLGTSQTRETLFSAMRGIATDKDVTGAEKPADRFNEYCKAIREDAKAKGYSPSTLAPYAAKFVGYLKLGKDIPDNMTEFQSIYLKEVCNGGKGAESKPRNTGSKDAGTDSPARDAAKVDGETAATLVKAVKALEALHALDATVAAATVARWLADAENATRMLQAPAKAPKRAAK